MIQSKERKVMDFLFALESNNKNKLIQNMFSIAIFLTKISFENVGNM